MTASGGVRAAGAALTTGIAALPVSVLLAAAPAQIAGGDGDGGRPAAVFPLQAAWTTDLGQPPAAAPGYDDLQAYVPLRDGTLTAVRLSDGSVVWRIDQPTALPPAAGGDSVIVADGAALIARRSGDARTLWTRDFAAPVSAAPLRRNGWLIAPLANGEVVTLRAADGREFWRAPLDGPLRVQPALGGRRLFVPVDDGRLVALDLVSGARLWERRLNGNPREVLPLDAVFVGATDNYLYRLSLDDGSTEWRWRAGGDVAGAPVTDGGRLFFVSLDNTLWALDRDTGVQQWRRILTLRPRAGLALVGETLFVSGVSAQIHTFHGATGAAGNVLSAPGELGAPPRMGAPRAGDGVRIVLLTADGQLVGMAPASGPRRLPPGPLPPPLVPAPERPAPADLPPFEPPASSGSARDG